MALDPPDAPDSIAALEELAIVIQANGAYL